MTLCSLDLTQMLQGVEGSNRERMKSICNNAHEWLIHVQSTFSGQIQPTKGKKKQACNSWWDEINLVPRWLTWELVNRLKTDSHCPTVALGESKKKKMFDFFSLNWLFYTCRKCKITADTKYTTSHTQCILTVHIKVNLFRVSWPTVMFFMPRAGFICCAVVLIHRDLMLGSAQRRAIRFLGCDL